MTTVLSVGGRRSTQRCDGSCHNAKTPGCQCCCGGRFHGMGSVKVIAEVQQAIANGLLGEVVTVDRPAQVRYQQSKHPEVVRFHRRGVVKALQRARQESPTDEVRPGPARVAAARPL